MLKPLLEHTAEAPFKFEAAKGFRVGGFHLGFIHCFSILKKGKATKAVYKIIKINQHKVMSFKDKNNHSSAKKRPTTTTRPTQTDGCIKINSTPITAKYELEA